MSEIAVQVTARDVATGESGVKDVPLHDYFVLTTGDCHVDQVTSYSNGTVVLTIKGRRSS